MSSIVIRDASMPKSCMDCLCCACVREPYCMMVQQEIGDGWNKERPSWCPIVCEVQTEQED